jgi:translation initiation factor IF-3
MSTLKLSQDAFRKDNMKREVHGDMINDAIRAQQVRVVSDNGSEIISRREALDRARNLGLDLVLIADGDTPVCKILDHGKYKFEKEKRERAERQKARANEVHVREIQLRPVTDDNDISIKARKTKEFLEDGDKVKIKVKFRGREVTHAQNGREVIESLISQIGMEIIFEQSITLAGRDMLAVIKAAKK